MNIKPIGDNIILKLENKEQEKQTVSGILLVSSEQNVRKDVAIVAAVGEGRILNNGTVLPSRVKVGDKVIFNKYAGTEIESGQEKYLIIKESDILAITQG